jgi:hypothetical protein
VESRESLCGVHLDSGLMIQKYIDFVVFKVDSTWTERSPSGLKGVYLDSAGVQVESNQSVSRSVKYILFYCYFSFISIFGSMLWTLKTVPNIVDNNK